jgi:hypothetical protein
MRTEFFSSYHELVSRLEGEMPTLTREQQVRRLRLIIGQVVVQAGIAAGTRVNLRPTAARSSSGAVMMAEQLTSSNSPSLLERFLKNAGTVAMIGSKLVRLETVIKQDDPDMMLAALRDLANDLPAPGKLVITA